ncbi:TerB family tellurite resistance protein [Thalassotalea sp. G2M2-11]|uniref:tellurite resistance TerB family protein n=1 Tax=Thalassotalea sp. G2M2-11 TaxID=2787627 RepID=UPI0019D308FB|nr:TerB family tellurite resistance protein [Thalassotalea sp. G2M2-11]
MTDLWCDMLAKIANFFNELQKDNANTDEPLSLEMACTVLLCEVMRADGQLDANEQKMLSKTIQRQFALEPQAVEELISKAKELSEHAIDFHQFTSKVNRHYNAHQKTEMVALLWKLALADGEIASIEEHVIRKIADLLHLSRAEYARAKSIILT